MGTQEGTVRDGGILGIAKPDAKVEVVRAAQSRPERYQVVLPRQDDRGWRMARVEAASGRRELIAPDLCGARSIHLSVVTLPVGLCDQPHWHVSGEKVMYVVSGHGRIHGGEELEDAWDIEPGDAVYVPPFAVHAPENIGDEPFEFVMASNAPLDVTIPGGPMRGPSMRDARGGEDMSEQGAQMVADRWVEDPSFRTELRDDTEGAVKRIGADLDPEQLEYLRSIDWSQSDDQLEELINKPMRWC